jgi:hypothetical protein
MEKCGVRGVLKKITLLFSQKPHFNEAMDENENLFSSVNEQGEKTHHSVRYARDGKSLHERSFAAKMGLGTWHETGAFRISMAGRPSRW